MIDFKTNWDDHIPCIEFSYNNNNHSSIQMAPYKSLYGRRCISPIGWFEVDEAWLIVTRSSSPNNGESENDSREVEDDIESSKVLNRCEEKDIGV